MYTIGGKVKSVALVSSANSHAIVAMEGLKSGPVDSVLKKKEKKKRKKERRKSRLKMPKIGWNLKSVADSSAKTFGQSRLSVDWVTGGPRTRATCTGCLLLAA